MPLKLLLDENLRHDSIRLAIAAHQAAGIRPLEVVRVGDQNGPEIATADVALVAWGAVNDRVIVSLDAKTLSSHLKAFVEAGNFSPGVIVLRHGLSARDIVTLLELIAYDTQSADWANTVRWVP